MLILEYVASVASAIQAVIGNLPARGVMAYLQSAAMNGYGLPTVKAVTRIGVVVFDRVIRVWNGTEPGV